MEWLIDALREPLVELVNLAVTAGLALLVARLRGRQHRAHDVLRAEGLLPPRQQTVRLVIEHAAPNPVAGPIAERPAGDGTVITRPTKSKF